MYTNRENFIKHLTDSFFQYAYAISLYAAWDCHSLTDTILRILSLKAYSCGRFYFKRETKNTKRVKIFVL